MRIEVDQGRCEGHALCEAVAPEFFSVDDDGCLTVSEDEVAPRDQARVQDAILACPVAALRVTKDLSRE